jgi:hypothetical protein
MAEATVPSRASRFRNADIMGVRRYIEEGTHVLLVKRASQALSKNTDKLKKNPTLENTIIEFKVIKTELSAGTEMIVDDAGKPTKKADGALAPFEPLRPNESVSLCETSEGAGYLGNVLTVTAGILGMTVDEMNADENFDAFFDGAYGPAQIFVGMLVRCVAQQVKTTGANAKSPVYTAKSWEAIPVEEYEEYGLVAPEGAFDPNGVLTAEAPPAEAAEVAAEPAAA